MNPRPQREMPSLAFTLIEMLVVVATIAVLAGLLLPSIAMARDKARQTVDRGNFRQIHMAIEMYTSDWRGRLPNARTAWPSMSYLYPDHPTALPGHSEPGENPAESPESLMTLLDPYLREPGVWVNPNAVAGLDENGEIVTDPSRMLQSYVVYGYNHSVRAYGRLGPPAPPSPPFHGSWSPMRPEMETFYGDHFDNLDGRPPGVREKEIMNFWVRNSHFVEEQPPTHRFRLPHNQWIGRPAYHVLRSDGRIEFVQDSGEEGTARSAW